LKLRPYSKARRAWLVAQIPSTRPTPALDEPTIDRLSRDGLARGCGNQTGLYLIDWRRFRKQESLQRIIGIISILIIMQSVILRPEASSPGLTDSAFLFLRIPYTPDPNTQIRSWLGLALIYERNVGSGLTVSFIAAHAY
jgi:hypothetical protein